MRIRELLPNDRPRERLRRYGPRALSLVELLALVLGTGSRRSALALAHHLLATCNGSLRRLATLPPGALTEIPGFGLARAAAVAAALELGRRLTEETRVEGALIRVPRDVYLAYAARLEDLPVEEFHVAVLDAQQRFERDITVTRGILNGSLVHPREVFREAIAERAASIILVHNHPSGDPTPSLDDRMVTNQLVLAGRVLDIPVQDHVVIGRGRYVSFVEAGLMPSPGAPGAMPLGMTTTAAGPGAGASEGLAAPWPRA
ncbi:MAG TPA: DNA repair protein RadC [Gemmatimonadaceae bacterium]|nr:DNA repair protein RadC [Gemmatimonadaceae bacterium]